MTPPCFAGGLVQGFKLHVGTIPSQLTKDDIILFLFVRLAEAGVPKPDQANVLKGLSNQLSTKQVILTWEPEAQHIAANLESQKH